MDRSSVEVVFRQSRTDLLRAFGIDLDVRAVPLHDDPADLPALDVGAAPDELADIRVVDVVPLASVAKETKSMPDAFIAENGHDVTDAFLAYARPLVGELPVKAMLKGME